MMNIEKLKDEFNQKATDFLVPIQTSKVVKLDCFESLRESLEKISLALKDIDLISKSLLNEVYVTIKILRGEAPYFSDNESRLMIYMANNLEYVFELILKNEAVGERKPGVPRIL